MGWWAKKDEELPEELRDMKPEDLVKAVKDSQRVAELETKLEQRNAEFDGVKQRLDAIEANQPESAPNPNAPQRPTSVLVDEERAFAERQAPLAMTTLLIGANAAKSQAKMMLGPTYAKFEKEIEAEMEKVPLGSRIHTESWKNVHDMVVGRHMSEIAKEPSQYFTEPGGGTPPPEPKPDPDKLSDEEVKIARKMGVSPEQYLASKKSMQFVGA